MKLTSSLLAASAVSATTSTWQDQLRQGLKTVSNKILSYFEGQNNFFFEPSIGENLATL